MIDQKYINDQELRDFVAKHNLEDRHNLIYFNSIVDIITSTSEILYKPMKVMVSYKNHDSKILSLMTDLDESLYPTTFKAMFGEMIHIENKYLKITGKHPTIGKYIVNIIPGERLSN